MKYLLIGGLLAASMSVQAGELYRWVDDKGKVHYGDSRPPAVEAEKKKFSDTAAPGAGLPYETQRAQQHFPVTLYVADSCGEPCVRARAMLAKRGIPFVEKNLVEQAEIDAFKAASGGENVPALLVGKIYLHGFNDGRWHSELDIAGYPKLAPYRPRAEPAPTAPPATKQDAASAVAPTGVVAP